MNVLDGDLKVVYDLGDQRGYESLGLLGVLCNVGKHMRSRKRRKRRIGRIAESTGFMVPGRNHRRKERTMIGQRERRKCSRTCGDLGLAAHVE